MNHLLCTWSFQIDLSNRFIQLACAGDIGDAVMKKTETKFLTPGSLQPNGETDLERGTELCVISAIAGEVEGINRASNRRNLSGI